MANKCDPDLYGRDDTATADRIASDALSNTAGTEDVWGSARQGREIDSKDGTKSAQPGDVKMPAKSQSDSRAKSKGNS